MTQEEIYFKIKKMLKDSTLLKCDCGVLCDRACCKGDNVTGMILFPNERTDLKIIGTEYYKLAVCNGECNREDRPISCMFFPLMPIILENKIDVIVDYRGFSICPLIQNFEKVKFNRVFVSKVKKAGKLLTKDKESFKLMKIITRQIIEEKALIESFNKEL